MDLTPFFFGLAKFVKYGLYPLTWLVLLLSAATVLVLLPRSPTRLTWLKRLVLSALLLLLLLSTPLVGSVLIGSLESWHHPPPLTPSDRFDAIVVLGGGVQEKGSLRPTTEASSASKNRVTCGVDLYQHGYAPTIVLSGGDASVFDTGPQEAVEMKRWAVRLGMPESALLLDSDSRNTYENATETKRRIGPASILLVSSASHLPRAVGLFRQQGFRVTPAPCDYASQNRPQEILNDRDLFDFLPNAGAVQQSTTAVSEMAGYVIYWLAGKL